MINATARLIGAASIALLCTGCLSDPSVDKQTAYLPYWEHCSSHLKYLEKALGVYEQDFSIRVLQPKSPTPVPAPINGLVEIEHPVELSSQIDGVLNGFLMRCGPNAIVSMELDSLSEDSIKRVLSEAPGAYDEYKGKVLLSVEGDTTSIFYTQVF